MTISTFTEAVITALATSASDDELDAALAAIGQRRAAIVREALAAMTVGTPVRFRTPDEVTTDGLTGRVAWLPDPGSRRPQAYVLLDVESDQLVRQRTGARPGFVDQVTGRISLHAYVDDLRLATT